MGHNHSPDISLVANINSEHEVLEQAIRELLIDKGVITEEKFLHFLDDMDNRSPADGARFVAKFWTDESFKKLALRDGKAAAEAIGIDAAGQPNLIVLENQPNLHHVTVCTLCSCSPRFLLGRPPSWYKGREYRSRVVREPRKVLAEFGLQLPENVEVLVEDATADCRHLVIPLRPAGTGGMSEDDLAELVTHESMIGVGVAKSPDKTPNG